METALYVLSPQNYAFNPYALPTCVTSIFFFLLGVLVIIRERLSLTSFLYFLMALASGAWLFCFFWMYSALGNPVALWWAKAAYVAMPVIPAATYHFTVVVMKIADRYKKFVWAAWVFAAGFSMLDLWTDFLFGSVHKYWWGYYPAYRPQAAFFLMFFLLTMLACLGHYWVEYQRAPAGDYKSRTKWFLIAYAGALLASWDFMPNFGVALYPIGYLSVFCWLVFVERAIWRYQLIDITPAFAAEHIFKMMADALLVFDQEEVVQLANEAACELLGRPRAELIGRRLSGLGDCVFDTKQFMVGATSGYEMKLADTRRGELVLDLTSSPIRDRIGRLVGTVCIARDVTERKRAEQMIRETEERFRQSQKMEAIGRLAGGVAHDFNNALTVILGYSSTLANRLQSDDVLRRDAEEIMRAGSRAASLTRQLLAFSRKQVLQPKVLDLNAVLKGLEPMLRRLIGEDVELIITTISGRAYVKVDHGQVEQIIMNLAVNARDAMPRGGTLTIGTKAGFGRDAEVLLIVTDTGCGMDAETQTHIFEPFFTTKDKGKGTGLGLSTVYGIVKQSGGQITVESQLGLGSTFVISFPLAVETAVPEEVGKAAEVQTGTETILLVEDEQAVRALIRDTLAQQGYKVLEASDSKQAFIVAGHHELDIHLLLTDVIMPVMSGRELAERFSSSRPKMRVLYISGYTDDDVVRHGILKGSHAFLQKPFTPEVLLVKVRQVLDEPASKRQTVSTALR